MARKGRPERHGEPGTPEFAESYAAAAALSLMRQGALERRIVKKVAAFMQKGITPSCYPYRHYGPNGDLLYVGISLAPLNRTKQHASARWMQAIVHILIEPFESREEALAAEERAIAEERPRFNKAKNRRKPSEFEPLVDGYEAALFSAPLKPVDEALTTLNAWRAERARREAGNGPRNAKTDAEGENRVLDNNRLPENSRPPQKLKTETLADAGGRLKPPQPRSRSKPEAPAQAMNMMT